MNQGVYLERWMVDPNGGGYFPQQRDAIAAHARSCASLQDVWLPRRQGKVCPSDLSSCAGGCGVTFFNEGVAPVCWDCTPEGDYCFCCRAKQPKCGCGGEPR